MNTINLLHQKQPYLIPTILPRYTNTSILLISRLFLLHKSLMSCECVSSIHFLPFELIKDETFSSYLCQELKVESLRLFKDNLIGHQKANARLRGLSLILWRFHKLFIRLIASFLPKSFIFLHYKLQKVSKYSDLFFSEHPLHILTRRIFYLIFTNEFERRLNIYLPSMSQSSSSKVSLDRSFFHESNLLFVKSTLS